MQRFGPWRRELRSFLEILALTGLALTQPTLDILSKNATIFVTHGASPVETVVFTLAVVLVPPLLLWALEVLVGLVAPAARRVVHAAIAALLVGVLVIEVLKKQTGLGPLALVLLAVGLGIGAGILVLRAEVVRLWLRYLALAPVVFAVLFLFFSPVTDAVFQHGPTSAADVTIGKPDRVVMIVMDEFPIESILDGTGKVDATLFPNFAALADGSTWYRNNTTVAGYTQVAIPAILTADLPKEPYPVGTASVFPKNLFTLLGGAYEINAHESATRMCPSSFCGNTTAAGTTSAGFGGLLGDAYEAWREFASPERKKAAISFNARQSPQLHAMRTGDEFVHSLAPGDGARLDFVHVLLPHQPWHYLPSGQDYERGAVEGAPFYGWIDDWVAAFGRERHLLQLQAADRLLGRAVAKLKRLGVYDESLVVLTADHGVGFTAKNSIRARRLENYPQIMWTPLFIKTPGQTRGVVDDRPTRSIDVVPTVADLIDAKIPWKVDGRSVLGKPRPDGPREFYEWKLNQLKPPAGEHFLTVPGPAGFARALAGRASAADGDPDLRLYKVGPFGDLVGRAVSSLPTEEENGVTGSVEHPDRYEKVDPRAANVPWAYIRGTVDVPDGQALAVAVNGRIAAMSESYAPAFTRSSDWFTILPPQLVRRGRNDVRLYLVRGEPDRPTLEPVQLGG